jgi:exonuclease SbcC
MNDEDTSRSNGTGKTNLCEAIGWAIWGESKAKKLDYNIKEGHDSCSVTLEFSHDDRQCSITRTRNSKNQSSTVDLIIDGEVSNSSSLDDTNKKIIEFLRLDYDTYINSVYLKQDDIYSLANPQKSNDGRNILEKVLNLEEYDLYEKSAKLKIKDLELSNVRLNTHVDMNKNIDSDILSYENSIEVLEKESEVCKAKAGAIKINLDTQQKKCEDLKDYDASLKSINDEMNHLNKLISLTSSQMEEIKAEGSSLKKINAEKEAELLLKIGKEAAILEEIEKFKDKIRNNEINKNSLAEIADKIKERRGKMTELQCKLEEINPSVSVSDHKVNTLALSSKTLKDRIKNLKLSSGEMCSTCLTEVTENSLDHAKKHLQNQLDDIAKELTAEEANQQKLTKDKVELLSKINNLDASIVSLQTRKDELLRESIDDETIEGRKSSLRDQLIHIKQYQEDIKVARDKTKLNQLREKYTQLQVELDGDNNKILDVKKKLESLSKNLSSSEAIKKSIHDLTSDLDAKKESITTIAANIQNKLDKIKELKVIKKEVDANKKLITENSDNLSVYVELLSAFSSKGIRAEILENAILELEKESDALLKKLTAGRLSVEFVTKKEVKSNGDKTEKTVFEIHINDGEKTLPFSMYSGGEKFRISFVLRIALSKLLLKRANSKLEFLIIDEAISPLDQDGVENMMQIIDALQEEFRTILVITHRVDVRHYFDNHIIVSRDASGSKVMN